MYFKLHIILYYIMNYLCVCVCVCLQFNHVSNQVLSLSFKVFLADCHISIIFTHATFFPSLISGAKDKNYKISTDSTDGEDVYTHTNTHTHTRICAASGLH